jgi:hypothetical protein
MARAYARTAFVAAAPSTLNTCSSVAQFCIGDAGWAWHHYGYRPAAKLSFPIMSQNGQNIVPLTLIVNPDGTVRPSLNDGQHFSFDGMTFRP